MSIWRYDCVFSFFFVFFFFWLFLAPLSHVDLVRCFLTNPDHFAQYEHECPRVSVSPPVMPPKTKKARKVGVIDSDDDDDDDDCVILEEDQKAVEKKPCPYGGSCLRSKNPDHCAVYSHPVVINLVDDEPARDGMVIDLVSPVKKTKLTKKKKNAFVMDSDDVDGDGGKDEGKNSETTSSFGDILQAGQYQKTKVKFVLNGKKRDRPAASDSGWIRKGQSDRRNPGRNSRRRTKYRNGYEEDSSYNDDEDEENDGTSRRIQAYYDDYEDEVDEEDELVCERCGLSFPDWNDLQSHLQNDHKSTVTIKRPELRGKQMKHDRSDRLLQRNEKKVMGLFEVQEKPVLKKIDEGPKTMEELISECRRYSADLGKELKDLNPSNGLISEQPQTFSKQGRKLQPHQMQGLNWLYLMHQKRFNGILADEMGLGKTVQAIALLTYLKEQGEKCSAIIVVPASVISNWFSEIRRWSPLLKCAMYYGSRKERDELQMMVGKEGDVDVLLTTYTTVINDEDRRWLRRRQSEYLIVDEAHEVRNSASLRHKALVKLGNFVVVSFSFGLISFDLISFDWI